MRKRLPLSCAGAIAALALLSCIPALADPPPLTVGPVVYPPDQPGGVPASLYDSERGLAIPFADIGDVIPGVGSNNDTIFGARYIADTGTSFGTGNDPVGEIFVSIGFGYTLTETTVTNTATAGGGVTAIVRAGGLVLGSATAATGAEARAQALAAASVPALGGRLLAVPTISNGGIIETVTETIDHLITGRDTYFGPGVITMGPGPVVIGSLGRCDRPYGNCEGGITHILGVNDTSADVLWFQDLYAETVIDRLITSSGLEYLDFVFASAGYAHPAAQTVGFELSDRFLGRILSPGVLDHGVPVVVDGEVTGLSAFLEGTGLTGSYAANGPVAPSSFGFAGVRGGLSQQVSGDLALGAAFEAGGWSWSLADAMLPEEASGDSLRGGVFASWTPGQWRLSAAGFAGRQGVKSTSSSTLGGGTSTADYDAAVYGAGAEAGYAIPMSGWTLTPSAGLSWLGWYSQAFAETGGLAPLLVDPAARTQLRPNLGLAVDTTLDLGEGRTLSLGASGRVFAILGDRQGSVSAGDGGLTSATAFTIDGPDAGSFGGEIGAHAALHLTDSASFTASWSSQFTGAGQNHAGQVGFKIAF